MNSSLNDAVRNLTEHGFAVVIVAATTAARS
jgi:hypothetical protein